MFIVQATVKLALGNAPAGNPYLKGKLSTVDLLVLTSLEELFFIMKIFNILQNKPPQ
jgi:hypothetical protein